MIKVRVEREKDRFIRKLTLSGHAGYAPYGSDIVCAAVSAIAYTAAGGLENLVGIKAYQDREGHMTITLPADLPLERKNTASIIMETAVIGLKQIQYKYGEYLKIIDEEV